MLKTFKQIREFNVASDGLFSRKPAYRNTKFGYALEKIGEVPIQGIIKDWQRYNSKIRDEIFGTKEIDNALTDKVTGAVLFAPRGSERKYLYGPEGLKVIVKLEDEYRDRLEIAWAEYDTKEFEIPTYVATEVPDDLTDKEKEAFSGFVIAPQE